MPFENGVEWKPVDPQLRGRHATFDSALAAAFADLTTLHSPFHDALADNWRRLFPDLPARPGRCEDNRIYLYVRNPPTLFLMRPKLPAIRRKLAELPGAPARLEVRLEVHGT